MRITFGAEPPIADWDHVLGSLALAVVAIAATEVARAVRFLLIPIAAALCVTPFVSDVGAIHTAHNVVLGVAMIALCLRRGEIVERYGAWNRLIA